MDRFLLPIFLAALAANPAEPATVVAKPSAPVVLRDGREVIEFRDCRRIEKGDQCELVFSQRDADTRQIRLVFEARFDWSGLGGYAPGLRLSIKGQSLVGARLLNKPLQYKTRNGGGNRWAAPDGASYFVMYSADFSDEIFPFTPLEVRPGYLICQERIVTRLSGRFGWNDASAAEIFVYDGEGKRTSGSEVTVVQEAGTSVFEVRMPTDHVAIIVRR